MHLLDCEHFQRAVIALIDSDAVLAGQGAKPQARPTMSVGAPHKTLSPE